MSKTMISMQCWNELREVIDVLNSCESYFRAEDTRQAALFMQPAPKEHPLSTAVMDAATRMDRILQVDLMKPPEGTGGDIATPVEDDTEPSESSTDR
jgi:hypothetical protein